MSESYRYYAGDVATVSRALRGGAAKFNHQLRGEFQIVTEVITARMFQGEQIAWDEAPLRDQNWETYAELTMLIGMACTIDAKEVGWDAWPGQERLLAHLWNWDPLDATFAKRFLCRPISPFYFSRRHLLHPTQQTPYFESYPHGYFLQDEIPRTIAQLYDLIRQHYWVLANPSATPIDDLEPGQTIDLETRRALLLAHADDERMVWQFNRAIPLYNALCAAQKMDKDLLCVGY